LTAKEEFELAMNAMGGIVWCLKKCLIDTEILTMRNFELYQPVDNLITDEMRNASQVRKALAKQKYMVLDSVSLINLEIFENNFDGTQSGTLFERVDFCMTQFGKRLLKNWLVNPLCDPDAINDRLDAIEDLRELDDQFETVTSALRTLPDLERLVSKVHQLGNVRKDHPDSRAVMFENDVYSKRKVEDFVTILNSFTAVSKMLTGLKENVPKFK
jgi:DNA mismatch repair protein MSH6